MSTPGVAKALESSFVREFSSVGRIIKRHLPPAIDGKVAILSMKRGGSRQWRQMEWIGFYLEFFVETEVLPRVGGQPGPTYGRTKFDLMLVSPWDLKSHLDNRAEVILNDVEAVHNCLNDHGALNYLILNGAATYDDTSGSFRRWHDTLKGTPSNYVNAGNVVGRTSRRRKISLQPQELLGFHLTQKALQKGLQSGAVGYFQEGMRNSNGNPRRSKYQLNLQAAINSFVSRSFAL
jgi:hypothetical protein